MGVLAELHDSEEPVAIRAKLPVDFRVDGEGQGSALLAQLRVLVVQCLLIRIGALRLVDADVENIPLSSIYRRFKFPVAQNVRDLVAIAQRVVRWAQAALLADVYTHEAERKILCPAVLRAATNEILNGAALGHGACKGMHKAESMWVLPQSALAERSQVVEGTLFIEVVVEEELFRRLEVVLVLGQTILQRLTAWADRVCHGSAIR